MNIQELQSERDALQKRLRVKIQQELELFFNTTGIYVESVGVGFVSYMNITEPKPRYLVNEVQVYLDI